MSSVLIVYEGFAVRGDDQGPVYVSSFAMEEFLGDLEAEFGSLSRAATALDVDASTLNRWRSGKIRFPSLDTFLSICNQLQLSPSAYIKTTEWSSNIS